MPTVDLSGFDLNLLRVFAALMRERSVTRAGERLNMSQPAVSAALNRLRHALDDQLFVRRGNDMLPTPRAEELSAPVLEALDQLQEALHGRREFDPRRVQRTYTLLGSDFFSMLLMPRLMAQLTQEAPHVQMRLLDISRTDVGQLLRDDAVDLVLEGPLQLPEWVSRKSLFSSEFTVIARRDDPEVASRGVSPGGVFPLDLLCSRLHAFRTIDGGMSGQTDAALAQLGRSRRVVLAVPHFYGVLLAVAHGGLIGLVPRRFAEAFAPSLDLETYAPPIEVAVQDIQMYWHSRHDRSPAHRWMRERVAAALARLEP